MDGEVHARETLVLFDLLDAEDREFLLRLPLVRSHEIGRMNEHSARAAGRIEDAAVIGLDDLDDELHDAGRRVILAALLHLLHREITHEIFVDAAEGVAVDGQGGERLDEFAQNVVADRAVVLRQRVGEVGVVALDVVHRGVQRPPEVRPLRQLQEMGEARLRREINYAARLERVGRRCPEPAPRPRLKLLLGLGEPPVGIAEEQKPEHGPGIFRRLQPRIGAQLVGDGPQPPLDVPVLRSHPVLQRISSQHS